MKRLFTFGCSFTEYGWPSWADLLSTNYDHYENWGLRGLGNRGISERIAECHVKNKFNENDVVIIQWSSHLRHDWFNLTHYPQNRNPGWKTAGSIFSPMNSTVFTKEWIKTFFHEYSYVMHTLNSIKLSQDLLKNSGCTWYMTSIGDLRNLGGDIIMPEGFGEKMPGTKSNSENFLLVERYPEFSPYLEEVWDKNINNWLEPLHLYANRNPEQKWTFYDDFGSPWDETHPSVTQYSMWVKEHLTKRLSISQESLQKIDKIVKIIEDYKIKSNHKVLDFAKLLYVAEFDTFSLVEKNKLKGYPL